MKYETVYTCDHCGTRSEPVVTGGKMDTSVGGLMSSYPQPPPGWASVSLHLDVPAPQSPESQAAEALKRKARTAAETLMRRMQLGPDDPQRVLIETQIQAADALLPARSVPFSTTMLLCSTCQVGPVFEVAQREIESASGVDDWVGVLR